MSREAELALNGFGRFLCGFGKVTVFLFGGALVLFVLGFVGMWDLTS